MKKGLALLPLLLRGRDPWSPDFEAYIKGLSSDEYQRLNATYESTNISRYHQDFEELLHLVNSVLLILMGRLTNEARPDRLDARTVHFAVQAALTNCARPFQTPPNQRSVLYAKKQEIATLSDTISGFIANASGGYGLSRGARPSHQQGGRDLGDFSDRRPDLRSRDTRDRHRGPPPSRPNRHAGPSRQFGHPPCVYDRGLTLRRGCEEEGYEDDY